MGQLAYRLHLDYWAVDIIGEDENPQAYHWSEISVTELPYVINCVFCQRDHYANECKGRQV